MKYIDYKTMKEFYTISEACELLEMNKLELKLECEERGIWPIRNEIGEAGFSKYDMRKLHNILYYAERENKETWDPWA